MTGKVSISPNIDVIENYYAIVDFACCEIVDANNASSGEYTYEQTFLPTKDGSKEELVFNLVNIDKEQLYPESKLPELKKTLQKLIDEFKDSGDEYEFQIIKITKKVYHYSTFDIEE